MLRGDDTGWKLVTVDEGAGAGAAPRCLQRLIHSAAFQIIVMLINLANAFVAASVRFVHDGRPREEFFTTYYYAEIGMFACSQKSFGLLPAWFPSTQPGRAVEY